MDALLEVIAETPTFRAGKSPMDAMKAGAAVLDGERMPKTRAAPMLKSTGCGVATGCRAYNRTI